MFLEEYAANKHLRPLLSGIGGKDNVTLKVISEIIITEKCNPYFRFMVKALVPSDTIER
jgi:hypothetical protein